MSRHGCSESSLIAKTLRIFCVVLACAAIYQSAAFASDSIASINVVPSFSLSSVKEPGQGAVKVFYATSRRLTNSHDLSYSTERSLKIDYGVCQVRLHTADERAHPSPSQKDFSKAVQLRQSDISSRLRFEGAQALLAAIDQEQAQSGRKGLIVFVHGYACSFEKAVRIGAKLSQGSELPVVIFAWPSRNNFLAYSADECNAEWSYPDFAQTLGLLSQKFSSENITLVSHSMGARIITWTLRDQNRKTERFNHIFFSCPDIDKETFARYSQSISQVSKDTRVFVSGKDIRLGVSELLHGARRMGRPGNGKNDTQALNGIETVDFSALDRGIGHCIPYPLIFQAMNHDQLPEGIELIAREGKAESANKLEIVRIARKHDRKSIIQ
jgi:esterase/lipase superfamily enzyme